MLQTVPLQGDLTVGQIRLNKWLSDCGVASRRKCDTLIEEGQVKINGRRTFELGVKIDPEKDRIHVNNELIKPVKKKIYYAFNKPLNVLTSMDDPTDRRTVKDFVEHISERVFPVGRLDWNSEGLLLITNDGEFSQSVQHPKEEITKTYLVKVDGKPLDRDLAKLLKGVTIVGSKGRVRAKFIEKVRRGGSEKAWIKIIITEGRNRQVRKMFQKIGFDVLKLQRIAIGQLKLGKMKKGELKKLSPEQIEKIFVPDRSLIFAEKKGQPISARIKKRRTQKKTKISKHL